MTDERDPDAPSEPGGSATATSPRSSASVRQRVGRHGALIAVALILSGLTTAIVSGGSPGYHVSSLAVSGSFFALAASGDTLYAASENGGSVLLEASTDRGISWTARPVPYSAVAGGAPWNYAAVAVDGSRLILAAAASPPSSVYYPYPGGPPVTTYPAAAVVCGSPSTILVATSGDGGLTWVSSTFSTANVSVTSLQAGIKGPTAAVAWLGTTTECAFSTGLVGASSSRDGGATWTTSTDIGAEPGSVPSGEGLEMAPESQGLVLAFGVAPAGGGPSLLSLWQLSDSGPGTFQPLTQVTAPISWTLQGDAGTSAYLLTPTYLIPLTQPPYTAIPFNELQQDGGGIGVLPHVVALVATGTDRIEVAATTSDDLGVDCWEVDVTYGAVASSCHVPIGGSLLPSSPALPIVSLIDGGGWWIAIGAAGPNCSPSCTGFNPGGPPSASAGSSTSVSTSVCLTGCSSSSGLLAYSYSRDTGATSAGATAVGGVLAALGAVLFVAIAVRNRRRSPSGIPARDLAGPPGLAPSELAYAAPRPLRRLYLAGLAIWVVVWLPLVALAFVPSAGVTASTLSLAIVAGGVLGLLATLPVHHILRQRLQSEHGIAEEHLLGRPPAEPAGDEFDRVRTTSWFAYASWLAAIAAVAFAWITLVTATPRGPSSTYVPASGAPSAAAVAVVISLIAFGVLRFLYHLGLERSVVGAAPPGEASRPAPRFHLAGVLGAALLPWNPLVGLVLGVALQNSLPWSPFLLAWAFLPVTLLGIALLVGCFGKTVWSPRALAG